ncbi:MAG: nucleoside monophosphate kinase [Candidatus Falkowbacteria bacterium]|nr:nucleoside monophosphate kinase [Candidatus Falkowbacteria bacterium]
MPKKIIVFFGPPGSGKGTQSEMLAETLGLPAISTGELLRREQKTGSVLGKHVKTLMASGKMLGVTLMDHILRHRLAKSDTRRGFLLDGYPRKIEQLRHFLSILKATDSLYFIVIEVSDKEVLRRLSGRRVCDCGASYHLLYNKPRRANKCDLCGQTLLTRADDTPKVIKQRLKYYHALTQPMLEKASGRGSLIFVNGEQSITGIKKELEGKLKEFGVIKKAKKKRKK